MGAEVEGFTVRFLFESGELDDTAGRWNLSGVPQLLCRRWEGKGQKRFHRPFHKVPGAAPAGKFR